MIATTWNVARLTGKKGNDGGDKSIRLVASSAKLRYSHRYGYSSSTENIIFTTSLYNINEYDTPVWECKDNSGNDIVLVDNPTHDIIKELDITTLDDSVTSVIVTVYITSQSITYSATVTLDKVYYDTTLPEHMGLSTTYPSDITKGYKLLNGDSFVLEETVNEKKVYTPYVYTGSVWVVITDEDDNVFPAYNDILQKSATSIFESGEDIDESSVALFGYFKNLVSTNAVIENLVAQNLTIGEGTGETGTGFRFRAKADSLGDGSDNPIIDAYNGNIKLFEIDPNTNNITIGDYDNGNGAFWDNSLSKFFIEGQVNAESGTIKGQLDTITIQTLLGGDTEYPKSDQTTIESLLTLISGEVDPEITLRMTGTINGDGFSTVKYGNTITQYSQKQTVYTFWGSSRYKSTSAIICTVSITFTMDDDSSVVYVLRKILGNTDFGQTYPSYPDAPTSLSNLITWSDFDLNDPDSNLLPEVPTESDYDSFTPLRNFPYSVLNISVWDSTQERLFLKNLPTSAPSESNRVWSDNGTLKIT